MPDGRAGLASVKATDNVPEEEFPPPPQAERKTTQARTAKNKTFFTLCLLVNTFSEETF
jgi:hypothetical protein